MAKIIPPTRKERKAHLTELERKWLNLADQKLVKAGGKPKRKPKMAGHVGPVQIVQGGKVSPR